MSDAERKRFSYFDQPESSFFFLQAAEPQTLAYALTDSPVGWLAWMIGKFQLLTDNNGDFLTSVDRDTFFDRRHSLLGYRHGGFRHANLSRASAHRRRCSAIATPGDSGGVCGFSEEAAVPPFRWITRTYNVVQRTEMPKGGHFAALEQPDLLLEDIRKFFEKLTDK